MKNIWLKHKSLILILGYAVIFVAVAIILTNYLVSGIISDTDQIQEQALDREVERARAEQLPQMEEDWNNFRLRENSLDIILNPANQIAFIENIESIADKTGNTVDLKIEENGVIPAVEKNKKPASKDKDKDQTKSLMEQISIKDYLSVQINLEGNFEGLVNFIHMLENSPIYINVISIQIKKELADSNSQNAIRESSDVFTPSPNLNPNPTEGIPEKKEVLKSTISAIVYTKK